MQWKRLNKSNFQSITISLCDESGQLMPFVSIGRTIITLSFRRRKRTSSFGYSNFYEQLCGSGAIIIIIIIISNIIVGIMVSYYASQMASSSVVTIHGPARQFGSGAGLRAFALRVGRTAMPLLKKYVGPFVKQVGQNVLEAALPEVVSLRWKGKAVVKQASIERQREKSFGKSSWNTRRGGRRYGRGRRCGRRATGDRPEKKSSPYSQIIVLLNHFKQKVQKSRLDILANVKLNNNSSVWQNEQ